MSAIRQLMEARGALDVARTIEQAAGDRRVELFRLDPHRDMLRGIGDALARSRTVPRSEHIGWQAVDRMDSVAADGEVAVPLISQGVVQGVAVLDGPALELAELLDLAGAALGRALRADQDRWDAEVLGALLPLQSDGVLVVTTDGEVVHYSDSLASTVGWTEEDVREHGWTNLVYSSDEERESAQRAIAALVLGKPSEGTRRTFRRKDGTTFPAAIWSRVVPHPGGDAVGLLGVMRDDSARGEAQLADLRHSQLAQLGHVARMVAHDFNNVLCVIMGHADLIALTSDDAKATRRAMLQIAASERGAELVRQLLAFGSPTAAHSRPVGLGNLVCEVGEMFRASVPEGVHVEVAVSDSAPVVDADASQLHHAVMNLLSNAAHAVGTAGRIEITAEALELPSGVLWLADDAPPAGTPMGRISVADDGAGFPQNALSQIFEPFFTTRPDGHGVGLSAVQGIMAQHGGAIDVRSDSGATVHLYLPISTRPEVDFDALRRTQAAASGLVWILDDQPQILEFSQVALSVIGWEVCTFQTIDALVEAVEGNEKQPTVLVLDRALPGGGGQAALERLRDLGVDSPVLWVSGLGSDGLEPFLQKPYTGRDLADAIGALAAG